MEFKTPEGEEERRKSPRYQGVLVEYSLKKNDPNMTSAFVRDVSATGLSIFVYEEIASETEIYLKIYSSTEGEPVIAKGKVIWQKESEYLTSNDKKRYDLGVEFTDIDKSNKERLARFMLQFEQLEKPEEEDIREI